MTDCLNKEIFKVALCDDEEYVFDIVNEKLQNYARLKGIEAKVTYYKTAETLLENADSMDMLLLDIDMPGMDGIEAGRLLNKKPHDYKVVMLTGRTDRFREAFVIEAFRFVTKPIVQEELFQAFDDVREWLSWLKKVVVWQKGIEYSVFQKDIVYIEGNRSTTRIFTEKNDFRSERTLAEWDIMLDSRYFFRCHKSFIVNMSKICKINKNVLEMVTGENLMISRRLNAEFRNAYMMYDTSYR